MFMHVPGIKVVMPATPADAKGLLIAAVRDGNPVLYIDDRWLYDLVDDVPEEMYETPIGKASLRKQGTDLTIVALSYMAHQATLAAEQLANIGIDAEVIDLRSLKPWDQDLVLSSVGKTGRLIIADGAWKTGGAAAEIAATVALEMFGSLKAPIQRVCLPDAPAPTSRLQEDAYYIHAKDIVKAAMVLMGRSYDEAFV
jgi:pyruvate dehydrogenase E1 component beta subunit